MTTYFSIDSFTTYVCILKLYQIFYIVDEIINDTTCQRYMQFSNI